MTGVRALVLDAYRCVTQVNHDCAASRVPIRPVAAGRRLANRAARYGVKRTFDIPNESLAETDRISLGRAFADYSPGRKSTAVRP